MRFSRAFSVAVLLTALCFSAPAHAQRDPHRAPPPHPRPAPGWHGDIHHFHEYDLGHWRGGRWFHGWHDERDGWWWIVAGIWYFYPAPVYPYPDPLTPPTVVVETAAPVSDSVYWYCADPAGYYPYVARCLTPWQRTMASAVVTTPPATIVAPPAVVEPQPQPVTVALPQAQPVSATRESDDRQLNGYAVAFSQIDLKNKKAALQSLKDLETSVESFRQSLFTRSYNAMDILHDAEKLRDRIAAERALLAKGKVGKGG